MLNTKSKPIWEMLDFDNNPEYELFKSTVNEYTDIAGFPVLYYVKLNEPDATVDTLYGENPNSEFSAGYKSKTIYDPTDETQILNSLGITSDDMVMYMQMPKEIFERDIKPLFLDDYPNETDLIPQVGDCIRTMWNNKLYELVDKGAESKIFQAQKLVWEFILKPYRYAEDSDSAHDMVFTTLDESDFPEINLSTESKELSALSDNVDIEIESNEIKDYDEDTSFFGYNTL